MIDFKDFIARQIGPAKFLGEPEFETLQDAVKGATEWIESEKVDVINIETVVLPHVHSPLEGGTVDVNIRQSEDFVTNWNQFIRVWYRQP